MDLPLSFFPCHYSFGYSLSHQSSYFRWSPQGTVSPPTMLKTLGRATTKKPSCRHPLRLLLSKCWLCKHRCFRPCIKTLVNLHPQPQVPPPPRDRLGDFQRTKPPTFSYAVEPMDANDWLKSVEKKLQVVQCNNCEKVLLASHQLSSPAADWWDAYMEAHEEPESINWPEFRAAFRAHHVP
jgi:hypothetical protein